MRLRNLLRRAGADRELEEELSYHLDREIEQNLAAGMPPRDARTAALRSLGGIAQLEEECRDARGTRWLEILFHELRYGVRMMRRTPGFSAACVLTIAIAMAASTSIFSLVYGVLLQPLPYRDPDRLVAIWTAAPRFSLPRAYVGAANYLDWRSQSRTLEDIALVRHIANYNLTGDGEPERLVGARLSANLFKILGVKPSIGRAFTQENERAGATDVVLLSDRLWRRRFAGDPGVVGRTIRLNGLPYTVLGVMPPNFRYPGSEFELWAPLYIPPDEVQGRFDFNYLAVGRLKPGVTLAQAQSDLDTISARLAAAYPENEGIRAVAAPLLADTVGTVRTALYALLGAVGCLLLIGAVNVANLFLARGLARTRDRALRSALGASAGRLAAQAILEVLPIATAGAVCGLAAAEWSLRLLLHLLPASTPRLDEVRIGAPVLVFSGALLLVTAAMVAFWPALQAARTRIGAELRVGDRSNSAKAGVREFLAVGEIALTVVLVAGSCLLARSFAEVRGVDPGFQPSHALSVHLAIPRARYPKDRDVANFLARILDRVQTMPGVVGAGMVNRMPIIGGAQNGGIEFEGIPGPAGRIGNADWRTATSGYFHAIGIPLVAGRVFTEFDSENAKAVGLIDAATAARIWPGQSPLGKRFRIGVEGQPWVEIVGVVGAIRNDGLDSAAHAQVYWNYRQRTQDRMALVLRVTGDPAQWIGPVITQVRAVDPEQAVYNAFTVDEIIDRSLSQRRLNALLVSLFAAVSLLLAMVGIYGVMAYAVEQRVREFGIRMALGARPSDVIRRVVMRGAVLGIGGAILGLAATGLMARFLATLLFHVSATDWISYTAAAAVLTAVALVASYLPVRRAVGNDPMQSLRSE
jgi:putative ABC transport system permease protein